MIAVRVSRRMRRIGYGVAVGAGIALAPFAAGAASADAGPTVTAAGPGAPIAVPHAKPAVIPGTVAARPAAAPVRAAAPVHAKAAPAQAKAARVPAPRVAAHDRRPVVVIGASVSSGKEVAAAQAYPRRVAALAGRPVEVSSRVGAGYAHGSMARLTRAANLPAQRPSLVVLQAGTNDVGAPPALIAGQVRQVVATVRQQAPGARIAVVTVFPSIHRGAKARATDAAIVGAARSVDPGVAVISPLEEGWEYRSAADGHPGAAAHLRLAERVSALV